MIEATGVLAIAQRDVTKLFCGKPVRRSRADISGAHNRNLFSCSHPWILSIETVS